MKQNEYILCAAIHYDDGKKHVHQCKNIESGFVVAGRRHHNCITTISILMGEGNYDKKLLARDAQGFITNTDKYVTRKEAYIIAVAAGQIEKRKVDKLGQETSEILISEDLYSEDVW